MSCCDLTKDPAETRTYSFDFGLQPELAQEGETLAPPPVVIATRQEGTGTLTIGTPTISGTRVRFLVSGGAIGDVHQITGTVLTSASHILSATGRLRVDRVPAEACC